MRYFIVAGEPSGDLHAAGLTSEILKYDRAALIAGWGGDQMSQAGVRVVHHYGDLAVMGFFHVIKKAWKFRQVLAQCKADIIKFHPDVLILVDSSGFNLQLIRRLHGAPFKIAYYILPKLWAWYPSRVRVLIRSVDLGLSILPFEKDFFHQLKYDRVQYVGNPTYDTLISHQEKECLKPSGIALLPGSRQQEVRQMAPVMAGLAVLMPDYQFEVAAVSSVKARAYSVFQDIPNVRVTYDQNILVISRSQMAVVTSGTATLEVAMLGKPQVVVYKTDLLSYMVARWLVHVQYISLVNLLLGRKLVQELIQQDLSPERVRDEVMSLLDHRDRQKKISAGYAEIYDLLKSPEVERNAASVNAAKAIVALGCP